MHQNTNKSYEKAKQSVMKRRRSTEDVKSNLRKEFRLRLQGIRDKMVLARRDISPTDPIRVAYENLKSVLFGEIDHNLDHVDANLALMDEIMRELSESDGGSSTGRNGSTQTKQDSLDEMLLQQQAEAYEADIATEISSMARLFCCEVCGEVTQAGMICENCSTEHFGRF